MNLADAVVLLDPVGMEFDEESVTWLVGLPAGVDPEAVLQASVDPKTGAQEIVLQSRQARRLAQLGGDFVSPTILILGSLALVESALIASAAFAVSIRRRQRELGLLAATGATPRQLAGIVVAEGAILGVVACVERRRRRAGWRGRARRPGSTSSRSIATRRSSWTWAGSSGRCSSGFVAAMIAAIVPARTVARVPVLLALSGRRPAQSPARRTLWFGMAAIGLAVP